MNAKPALKLSFAAYMIVTRPRPVPMNVAVLSAVPEWRPPTM